MKDPGSALCVCSALYVPIDKIKEQGDESGAKRRERGRERKERDALCLCRVTRGLVAALIGSPRIHLCFSFRLEIDFYAGQVCSGISVSGLHLWSGEAQRRDMPSTFENRSEKA